MIARVRDLEERAELLERRAWAALAEGMREDAARYAGEAADVHGRLYRIWARRTWATRVLLVLWVIYLVVSEVPWP
jgi:hypothetical protein